MDTTGRTAALVHTLAGDANTLVRNPNSTVVPPLSAGRAGAHVLAVLRGLSRPPPASAPSVTRFATG